ncbi:hypothetical protein [Sporichthya polymorpha]|uniref:hypothetical protein n=1 Tax=Sporichthya polymorpha TaxID=35751 RepID=UPI0012EB63FD|nr:hypothetical protein [Sporichthya polymorpha]
MRRLAGIVLAAALLTGAAACGGDDKDPVGSDVEVGTETGNLKPEDVRASASEVADGWRELERYADDVVAKLGSDEAALPELQERLLTIWEAILGSVKANDPATFDTADAALKTLMSAQGSADKAEAEEAADVVEDAGEDYLEKFPASGASASPSASSGSPSDDSEDSDSEDSGADDGGSDVKSDADPPISY